MQNNQIFKQLSGDNMNIANNSDEILAKKKREERKKLLTKIYKNGAGEIIAQIEILKIHFSKIGLDIKNPIHKKWIEEFAIIFDEDGEDAPIDICLDNIDIYLNKDGEPLLQFDFDDILENENFNMGHKILLNDILNEDGIFEESLFFEQLKICAEKSISEMIKSENQ